MSETATSKPPKWFAVTAAAGLVWNLLGVMAYVVQATMGPAALAALPEAQRQLHESTPAWATAAFAVAVNFGALGCVLLLLRKRLAALFLQLSLAGALVQQFHAFFIAGAAGVLGPGAAVLPALVLAIAVFLALLAARAGARGWTG